MGKASRKLSRSKAAESQRAMKKARVEYWRRKRRG